MWLSLICFVPRSSERIADVKTGSISIAFAIRTGRDGPLVFKRDIIFCFFSWMSIIELYCRGGYKDYCILVHLTS